MRVKWILLSAAIIAACGACSKGGEKTGPSEAWLEVQVSVRHLGANATEKKSEREVLRTFELPAPVEGKAGRAVATVKNARLDLSWDATNRLSDSPEGIQFEGFTWNIPNRVVIGDKGRAVMLSAGPKDQVLRSDFVLLMEPVRVKTGTGGGEIEVSVRARWVGAPPEAADLRIESGKPSEEEARRKRPVVGPF